MSKIYQRPTGAYGGALSLGNRTKYQEDASSQPRVAISSSKMDGDFNYIIDALNEFSTASGSFNSLADRLAVALNDDGTLKASVSLGIDDWINYEAINMVRLGDDQISLSGDLTSLFTPGRRVRLIVDGQTLYASIAASTVMSGTSTLTFADIVDISGSNAVIAATPTALAYSSVQPGVTGNLPFAFDVLRVDGGILRLSDSSTNEYGLRVNGNQLEIIENTGTSNMPVWSVITTIDSAGITVSNGSIGFSKLASGAVASQLDAEGGIASDKLMTPERTAQAIAAQVPGGTVALIATQTITSPVTAVEFTGLTDDYRGYFIEYYGVEDDQYGDQRLSIRLRKEADGLYVTSGAYSFSGIFTRAITSVHSEYNGMLMNRYHITEYVGKPGAGRCDFPNLRTTEPYKFILSKNTGYAQNNPSIGNIVTYNVGGSLAHAGKIDGIQILPWTGLDAGTFHLYGIK